MLATRQSHTNTLNHHPKEAKSIIAEPPGKFKEVFRMENKSSWMKTQIVTLLSAATDREISCVWHFAVHLIQAEGREAGKQLT